MYYIPELWKVISETPPGVYLVESCLSRTRKLSPLEHLAPTNIRSRALQTEVELQNQCLQLEKLMSTNSSLQKNIVEQELDNYCNKIKEATNEVLCKWSTECEALRENLKAVAVRNAEQEQSIQLLKQELADWKFKAAKNGEAIKNMEKMNNQLSSELEQLEHYNQYLANECQKKIISLIDKRVLLEKKKPKQRPRINVYPRLGTKANIMDRTSTLYEIFVGIKILFQNIRSRNRNRKWAC